MIKKIDLIVAISAEWPHPYYDKTASIRECCYTAKIKLHCFRNKPESKDGQSHKGWPGLYQSKAGKVIENW